MLGKGGKLGKVALPSLARTALDRHLAQRGLPVTPTRWNPATPLVASLEAEGAGIEPRRLWRVLRRFFVLAADEIQNDRRPLRNCGARTHTGCGTPTHRTRSGAELS
ncbi:hypothetical protein WL32_35765 [Burkholderia cepacia]|nr:hypothetical protein WL32_35765 [Burkholderia cepacia]KWB30582.1 hypothetical protein WL34_30425 [Burkholderia cepacia]